MNTIKVKASPTMGGRVALFEQHPEHLAGECFVAGDSVVEVAVTAKVREALDDGRLVLVEGKVPPLPQEETLSGLIFGLPTKSAGYEPRIVTSSADGGVPRLYPRRVYRRSYDE